MTRSRPPTNLERSLIKAALLPTWQTAAAIAQHAGVPARTAVTLLKAEATAWKLDVRRVRVDGHNEVTMFRQSKLIQVMGVTIPDDAEEKEEA